jgi:nucleoside-diphosphate-sugar epimerase
MTRTVFVAGASGVIGRVLLPLLVKAGYNVYGATRHAEKLGAIEASGAIGVVLDVYDADSLTVLNDIKPWAVVHQLTDLPTGLSPERMAQAVVNNARIRDEGTRNLVRAACAANISVMVAQSIAWAYQPGDMPYVETQPLDVHAQGSRCISVCGVAALEQHVLGAQSMRGTVLRYGQLYGPYTGTDAPAGASPVHVEAAARAVVLALQASEGGIFNITEDGPTVSSEKAKRVLDWAADMRAPGL